jgi:methylmalonyl-CoA/ethylmalonyl-CoA epimerase
MITKIDHVCVVVKDFEKAVSTFREILQCDDDHVTFLRNLDDEGDLLEIAILWSGHPCLEIISPRSKGSPMSRFIEKRGEGIHHIGLATKDLGNEIKRLEKLGLKMIDEKPRMDRFGCYYTFTHPKDCFGTMMEICNEWRRTGPTTIEPVPGVVVPKGGK